MVKDTKSLVDCGCPPETQLPANEADSTRDSCADLAEYPEPCPKGLIDLYCTKWSGSADVVFGIAPGDRGAVVIVKIMEKIKSLHGLGTPPLLLSVNNIILGNITSTTVDISWAAVAGATQYDLRYRVQGETTWQYVSSIVATNIQLTSLASNSIYEYELRARDATTGYSAWTLTATFLTLVALAKLTTPVGMVSTAIAPTVFSASWTPVPGATSYEVRVKRIGVALPVIMIYPGITATVGVLISVPESGGNYQWNVLAKANTYQDSDLSDPILIAVPALPPLDVSVPTIGQTTAIVAWTQPPNVSTYTLIVVDVVTNAQTVYIPSVSALSQAVSGLTPGRTYEARVYSYNENNAISFYYSSRAFITLP